MSASAMFVGFQMCFPFQRMKNLLPMAIEAVTAASHHSFARKRKQRPRPEMRALFHSNVGILSARVRTHWAPSATPMVTATWTAGTSKESQSRPYVRSPERQQICHQRGSKRRPDRAREGVASRVVIAPVPTSGGRELFPGKETGPSRRAGGRGLCRRQPKRYAPCREESIGKLRPSRCAFWYLRTLPPDPSRPTFKGEDR